MAPSENRRRGSRNEGSSSRVVMVQTKKTSAGPDNGGATKKKSIAGGMWDSFESESPSEEEKEEKQDDDDADTSHSQASRRSREQHRQKGNNSATTPAASDRRRDRPRKNSLESFANKKRAVEHKREDERKGRRSHGNEDRGNRSDSRSYGSAGSETHSGSESSIRVGDNVAVYLKSGGKAKGTVSVESSRDRYEVTLENGDVEKRVHSRNISLLSSNRRKHRRSQPNSRTSSSSRSLREKSVRQPRESRDDAKGRQRKLEAVSESESETSAPSERRPGSIDAVDAAAPTPLKEQLETDPAKEDVAASLSPSTTASATNGGGALVQQPPGVITLAPITAPTGETTSPPLEGLASGSDPDTSTGERGSSSERGLSPLSSKVRQAQGLLKTMFWKRGEEQGDSEDGRRASRRSSRGKSISRRFSRGSGDQSGDQKNKARPSSPSGNKKEGESSRTLAAPTSTSDHSEDAASTPLGAAALKAHNAERTRQGLMRGRSRNRKDHSAGHDAAAAASESPASRSPSLATKLGMTLRGAIMGKAQLGVHKPHADRQASATGRQDLSGSEADAASDATYSTEASAKGVRRGSRQNNNTAVARGDHDQEPFGDGFDSDIFCQESPLAPVTYGGDPRNLPDVVHSYIDAREQMEHEMSAAGPAFLPLVDNLAATGGSEGVIAGWGKRRGSLDITKQASSTTQRTEKHQPFTEAMFKAGISETRHSTKQGILLEGDLQKFSPESMRGVRWHKRYFVLYACACELRYYRTHAEAAWGRIPLGERGSIPLRLVVKIKQPSDKKYRGCRFDLVVLHKGDSRYPGLHIHPGQESRVLTTKTFKFNAADAQQRLLWVTVIEALMKRHGWGVDSDRCRSLRAPRHGGPSAGVGDSLRWGSTWEEEADGIEHAEGRYASSGLLDSETGGDDENKNVPPPRTTSVRHQDLKKHTAGGADPTSVKGSVMAFVEDHDESIKITLHEQQERWHDEETAAETIRRTSVSSPQQQRGLRIPFSPGGKRGSLTTGALSPPVCSGGGARRQSSLKSDLRL